MATAQISIFLSFEQTRRECYLELLNPPISYGIYKSWGKKTKNKKEKQKLKNEEAKRKRVQNEQVHF